MPLCDIHSYVLLPVRLLSDHIIKFPHLTPFQVRKLADMAFGLHPLDGGDLSDLSMRDHVRSLYFCQQIHACQQNSRYG